MTGPLRVLVVDDDFRVAALHRDIVAARHGVLALEPVHTFAAARAAIRDLAPDLVIADVFLPDGDGIVLVKEASVDAFVVTAAADAATVRRALQAGALSVLAKPFESQLLADRLDRYARFRNVLGTGQVSQDDIDRSLALLHVRAVSSPVRTATEDLVLDALGADEASALDVAARIGVSRATAQRHLAALAARGLVDIRLRYGSTGRPEHRYCAARGGGR